MKKQNSLYRMTTSEMQIMTYLWDSKEPAIASQIVSDLIPTQNCTWKPRSVFTILKSLSEKDLIHDVGYVRTGKTYSRKFAPIAIQQIIANSRRNGTILHSPAE